ncbi:carboxypeptidase-like regulatory domain-containing protein [Hymenobacter tibetensis]|uniref:carboxypeptidase-like regulatory domain-containing protein n=1 Tax=Hymenobacter tibetensis TaxID=497967 RepID=UPI00374D531F
MSRLISICILFIGCSNSAFAQTGMLEGLLSDKRSTRGFSENATVSLPDLNIGAISDANGHFVILNVPSGVHKVKVECIGYRDTTIAQVSILAGKTTPLNINFPVGCHFLNQKGRRCPYCHREDAAIPLVYGLPDAKTLRMAKRQKVQLSGCMTTGCDPQWYCKRDNKEF